MKVNYWQRGDLDTVQGLSWRDNNDVWFHHDANVGWFNFLGVSKRFQESWLLDQNGKIIGD